MIINHLHRHTMIWQILLILFLVFLISELYVLRLYARLYMRIFKSCRKYRVLLFIAISLKMVSKYWKTIRKFRGCLPKIICWLIFWVGQGLLWKHRNDWLIVLFYLSYFIKLFNELISSKFSFHRIKESFLWASFLFRGKNIQEYHNN